MPTENLPVEVSQNQTTLDPHNLKAQNNHQVASEFTVDDFTQKLGTADLSMNNSAYSGLVTDLELAVFSALAYRDKKQHDSAVEQDSSDDKRLFWWHTFYQHGWNIFHHKIGKDGFRAIAYIHDERKQIVVAFRGTEPNEWATLLADWDEVVGSEIGTHGKQACSFTLEVVERMHAVNKLVMPPQKFIEDRYHLTLTGHSLGAWLASSACVALMHQAVVFDNPRVCNIAPKYRQGIPISSMADTWQFPLTSYLAQPNIINTAHEQRGYGLQLTTTAAARSHTGIISNLTTETQYSLSQHSIDLIVATFNPNTGKPYQGLSKRVLQWPHGGAQAANQLKGILPSELRNTWHLLFRYWLREDVAWTEWANLTCEVAVSSINWFERAMSKFTVFYIIRKTEALRKIFREAYSVCQYDYSKHNAIEAKTPEEEFQKRFEEHYDVIEFNEQMLPASSFPDSIYRFLKKLHFTYKPNLPQFFSGEYEYLKHLQFIHDKKTNQTFIYFHPLANMTAIDCRREILKAQKFLNEDSFREHELRELENKTKQLIRACSFQSTEIENLVVNMTSNLESESAKITTLEIMPNSKSLFYGAPKQAHDTVLRENFFKELTRRFSDSKSENIEVIYGLSGIGKTELAIRFAQEKYKSGCYQAVIWLEGDSLETAYQNFARYVLGNEVGDLSSHKTLTYISQYLSKNFNSILFVFDNVECYNTIRPFLSELPIAARVDVLITTRNANLGYQYEGVALTAFTQKEAAYYIRSNFPNQNIQDNEALELANMLDFHPGALSHLIGYIKAKNISIQEYITKYKNEILRIIHTESEQKHNEMLLLSIKRITEDSSFARQILNFCAFLSEDNISYDLLRTYFKDFNANEIETALQLLSNYGLIEIVQNKPKYLRVHRIVQETLRHELNKTPEDFDIIRKKILDFFNEQLTKYEHISVSQNTSTSTKKIEYLYCQAEVACNHFVQAGSWLTDIESVSRLKSKTFVEQAISPKMQICYVELLLKLGKHFQDNAEYSKAITHYKQVLALYQAINDDKNLPKIAECLNSLGRAFSEKKEYAKAALYYKQALVLYQAIHGDNKHHDIAACLNNLGMMFYHNGEYAKAEYNLVQSLNLYQTMHDKNNSVDVAKCLSDLGMVLSEKGDYTKAISCYEQALMQYKIIYGENNHPNIAACLNRLGVIFYKNGEYAKAEQLLEHALGLYKAMRDKSNSFDLAICLNNLGMLFHAQGNYIKATEYLEQALSLYQTIPGKDNFFDVAVCLNNLGTVFYAQGDYAKAISCHQKALVMLRTIHGVDNHTDIARCLDNLGMIFHAQGEYTTAAVYCEQALSLYRAVHNGNDHPDIAKCLNNLGMIFSSRGLYGEATQYYQQALNIRRKIYGADEHPDVTSYLFNIGTIFHRQGKYSEAIQYYQQALGIRRKIYGTDEHPDVATCLLSIGTVFYNQGNYSAAKAHYQQALDIRRKIYGTDEHPDVASCLLNIGTIFRDQGNYSEAKIYYRQALEIRRKIYGTDEHPNIASCLVNLGTIFRNEDRYIDASMYYQEAIEIFKRIYGTDEHPDIANCLFNLGNILFNEGKYSEANIYYTKSLELRRKIYSTDEHPEVAACLLNIGNIFLNEGKHLEAREHYQKALQSFMKIYGTDIHLDVAACLFSLGNICISEGKYSDAKEYCEKVLEIREKLYGTDVHPDIARVLILLSLIKLAYNRKEAYEDCRKAYDILLKTLGESHSSTKIARAILEKNWSDEFDDGNTEGIFSKIFGQAKAEELSSLDSYRMPLMQPDYGLLNNKKENHDNNTADSLMPLLFSGGIATSYAAYRYQKQQSRERTSEKDFATHKARPEISRVRHVFPHDQYNITNYGKRMSFNFFTHTAKTVSNTATYLSWVTRFNSSNRAGIAFGSALTFGAALYGSWKMLQQEPPVDPPKAIRSHTDNLSDVPHTPKQIR